MDKVMRKLRCGSVEYIEKDMGKLRVREEMRTREAQGAGRDMKNQEI